ncbi:MAG: hypothetical protein HC904_12850 [Blastochloris sp.]|nr:hypothetical protein [Blastochloris sp.]
MSSPLRIPPGVDFAFEKRVNAVLESAKPDYDRLPELRTELMEHLRQRWREGIEKNLSTEAAEEQALELFGDPEAIGKSLREVWWRRLLFYRRCRAERFLIMVSCSVWATYCLYFGETDYQRLSKELQQAVIEYRYASFMNATFALLSLILISHKLRLNSRPLRWLYGLRHCLWIFLFSYGLNIFLMPLIYFGDQCIPFLPQDWIWWQKMIIFLSIFLSCALGGACLLKEVKDTISIIRKGHCKK